MGCVYLATSIQSGKSYVGKTIGSLTSRLQEHARSASRGSDCLFHRAIRLYGLWDFKVGVLFESDDNRILAIVERMEISERETLAPAGYNLTVGGEGSEGYRFTDDQRKRMSEIQKGKSHGPHSEETKRKIGESNKGKNSGRVQTAEERKRRSVANIGQKRSRETRLKMIRAGLARESVSDDTRAKMSESQKRRKRKPHSDATKRKMSDAQKGRNQGKSFDEIHGPEKSAAIRAKISEALAGRPKSEDHRKHLSDAAFRRIQEQQAR